MLFSSVSNGIRVNKFLYYYQTINNVFSFVRVFDSLGYSSWKRSEKFYTFFFFFPKVEIDNFFLKSNSITSFIYYRKKHFVLKPNYQVIWRYFRSVVNKVARIYSYRQCRLTKALSLYGRYNGPIDSHLLGTKGAVISPAVQLYNWKYIV